MRLETHRIQLNFERSAPRNRRPQLTINRVGSARPHGAAAAQGGTGIAIMAAPIATPRDFVNAA
jgi:hypothetical protein